LPVAALALEVDAWVLAVLRRALPCSGARASVVSVVPWDAAFESGETAPFPLDVGAGGLPDGAAVCAVALGVDDFAAAPFTAVLAAAD
jgi:hypothetical protein